MSSTLAIDRPHCCHGHARSSIRRMKQCCHQHVWHAIPNHGKHTSRGFCRHVCSIFWDMMAFVSTMHNTSWCFWLKAKTYSKTQPLRHGRLVSSTSTMQRNVARHQEKKKDASTTWTSKNEIHIVFICASFVVQLDSDACALDGNCCDSLGCN